MILCFSCNNRATCSYMLQLVWKQKSNNQRPDETKGLPLSSPFGGEIDCLVGPVTNMIDLTWSTHLLGQTKRTSHWTLGRTSSSTLLSTSLSSLLSSLSLSSSSSSSSNQSIQHSFHFLVFLHHQLHPMLKNKFGALKWWVTKQTKFKKSLFIKCQSLLGI